MTDHADSVALYTRVIEEDPASPLFVRLAEALSQAGRPGEAVEACRRGLALHPDNLRARVLLGMLLRDLGETAEAARELEAARRSLEENAPLYRVLAEIRREAGEADEARRLTDLFALMVSRPPESSPDVSARVEEPVHVLREVPETTVAASAAWGRMAASTAALKGGDEAPPEASPAPESEAAPRVQPKVLGVLSSWLEKSEKKQPPKGREARRARGFSEAEREALRKLLLTKGQ